VREELHPGFLNAARQGVGLAILHRDGRNGVACPSGRSQDLIGAAWLEHALPPDEAK